MQPADQTIHSAPKKPFYNDHAAHFAPDEAARIQKNYRLNPGKTVAAILSGPRSLCDIAPEDLATHFKSVYAKKSHSADFQIFSPATICAESEERLDLPFSPSEIWSRIMRTKNTPPVPTRLLTSS